MPKLTHLNALLVLRHIFIRGIERGRIFKTIETAMYLPIGSAGCFQQPKPIADFDDL